MNDAVTRFAGDLFDAGIETRRRAVLTLLYDRALNARSPESWRRFYHALFSALRRFSHQASAPTWRSHFALRSLLRILEDDLGSVLFGTGAASRLRASIDVPLYFRPPERPEMTERRSDSGAGARRRGLVRCFVRPSRSDAASNAASGNDKSTNESQNTSASTP
ncbi:MAG: hypothetical protein JO113_01540 [Candidatus Eremiobacteraeota bacterium]|nr:hypothetical protein [Candidatus Eremiobacteraeota bacterium]